MLANHLPRTSLQLAKADQLSSTWSLWKSGFILFGCVLCRICKHGVSVLHTTKFWWVAQNNFRKDHKRWLFVQGQGQYVGGKPTAWPFLFGEHWAESLGMSVWMVSWKLQALASSASSLQELLLACLAWILAKCWLQTPQCLGLICLKWPLRFTDGTLTSLKNLWYISPV